MNFYNFWKIIRRFVAAFTPLPRRLLLSALLVSHLLLGVVVDRRLGVDDHGLGVVASDLNIPLILGLRVPRRSQRAELLAAGVLHALQLHLVVVTSARAAVVRAPAVAPCAHAARIRGLAGAGSAVGGREADGRHDLAEEGAEGCAAGGGDSESGLGARPEGNVGGGIKEVGLVLQRVYVRNAGDCCDGSTVSSCQCLRKN